MKFSNASNLDKRPTSDLLVIPFWIEKKKLKTADSLGDLEAVVKDPISSDDFKGDNGQTVLLYHKDKKEKRILLLGLGEKEEITVERLRRACGGIVKLCHQKKIKSLSFLVPEIKELTEEDVARGIAEGFLLANYIFSHNKKISIVENPPVIVEKVALIGASSKALKTVEECAEIASGVYLARDLVNGNADDITPQHLGSIARQIAKQYKNVKATVFGKKEIAKHKMGLLQAVSRGGPVDPAFIILEYKGAPKSKDKTVIIGKGVTFDTGGLNLKPTGSMETMKTDMSGAAAVLGTIKAIASLKLKVNVTAVIPSTENSLSDRSYKPGDVYSSYAGITVEIGNTDAEGRLILADALAYAEENLKPSRIIDLATLTGSMTIALGDEASGVMSSSDALADSLVRAGGNTHERLWRMPLFPEYRDQLKSEVADIKNIGGKGAGSITAAFFLKEFVDDTPWAHIDIAGTAFHDKGKRYNPPHATGFGVRLLVDFLKNL